MAFCEKCGAQLEEGAKFCTNCASPVGGSAPAAGNGPAAGYNPVPGYNPAPRKSGSGKLIGIIGGAVAAVALIVVVVILLVSGGGHGSPEAVAEAFIQAAADRDVDAYLDCFPEFRLEALADVYDCDVDELADEMTDEMEEDDDLEDIEIKSVKVKDEGDDLDDISSYYEKMMSKDDKDAFEGWAEVRVKVEVDGDTKTDTLLCICLDGSWYVLG